VAANHNAGDKRTKSRTDCLKTLRFAIAYAPNRGRAQEDGRYTEVA